jgi:hypothetical protein
MTTDLLAVVGNGSWGGPTRVHAASTDTLDPKRRQYRSLCGQILMRQAVYGGQPLAWADRAQWISKSCQRCEAMASKL